MLLKNVQIISDNGVDKFAVINFREYLDIKALIPNVEDYLDYLHIKNVKKQTQKRFSLE